MVYVVVILTANSFANAKVFDQSFKGPVKMRRGRNLHVVMFRRVRAALLEQRRRAPGFEIRQENRGELHTADAWTRVSVCVCARACVCVRVPVCV